MQLAAAVAYNAAVPRSLPRCGAVWGTNVPPWSLASMNVTRHGYWR